MPAGTLSPRDLFVGELRWEFWLSLDDQSLKDYPGGSALYAAAGYLIWEKAEIPGICTRIGEDFHHNWLEDFQQRGIDTAGVVVLPQAVDLRIFYVHEGSQAREVGDPVRHFSQAGLALPPALIGYTGLISTIPDRRVSLPTAIRESDLPASYQTATGAHLCPLDYLSHNLLPAVLRQRGFSTITMDPGPSYMDPNFLGDIPGLMPGLTAFLPAETDLRNLYKGTSADIWEMAGELARYGCELIVIKRGDRGAYLFDRASGKKWTIPAYTGRVRNPVGAGDAFSGGFLAGFRETFDPVRAALYGIVAESLVVEGSGPFFALDALPGLAEARLERLEKSVREI